MSNDHGPSRNIALINANNVPSLLEQIRPQWQAKNLIDRVRRLVEVDPSSACQRIFNAAIHDLREKIVIVGVDISSEAASQHRLPPVTKEEDIENYATSKLIDLAYRIGIFTRAEWRRVSRCYEIRRDLEHEDDQYEAGVEDIVYIFNTCIDVILSRDPVNLVKLTDFKDLVEQAQASIPDEPLLEDFRSAPLPRQEDIGKFLLSTALDKDKPDLVQQNAFTALSYLSELFVPHVKTALGTHLQGKFGRTLNERQARVAHVSGLMPYVRQTARAAFFERILEQMKTIGHNWSAYEKHGEILRLFEECGGLNACPPEQKKKIVLWFALTYIGTPGGVTQYGNVRKVFFSNSAAPIIEDIVKSQGSGFANLIEEIREDELIRSATKNQDVARRFESFVDLAGD